MLYLHIITGSVALLTGLLALVLRKGSVAHKRTGDMFFGAMLLCSRGRIVVGTERRKPVFAGDCSVQSVLDLGGIFGAICT